MGAGHAHALYVHEHSVVHRLPAHVKVTAALVSVVAIALTPRETPWAFMIDAAAVLAVARVAHVPLRFLLTRLVVVVPFVVLAVSLPLVSGGEQMSVAGLDVSREGVWAMVNIVAKATLGASISILLTATTEVVEVVRGFERLRVPPVLTAIATFMLRYLEVVAAEIGRVRIAMSARGHDPRWLWQLRPLAAASGSLFVRSYERGERVHAAMLSRGYTGVMPTQHTITTTPRQWLTAAPLPVVATALLAASWVLRP